MNTHLKLVAVLHIVFGALGLIGAIIVFVVFGTASGIVIWNGEPGAASIIAFVALCIGGLIAFLSVPDIIGGWGLLARKSWARVLVIILSILHLLNFPLGTALGIYSLWALLRDDWDQPDPQRYSTLQPAP